jgi:hypothetical protein
VEISASSKSQSNPGLRSRAGGAGANSSIPQDTPASIGHANTTG